MGQSRDVQRTSWCRLPWQRWHCVQSLLKSRSRPFTASSAFCRCSGSFARQFVHSDRDCFSSVMDARQPTQERRTLANCMIPPALLLGVG